MKQRVAANCQIETSNCIQIKKRGSCKNDYAHSHNTIRLQQATLTKAEKDIFLKENTEFFNLGLI